VSAVSGEMSPNTAAMQCMCSGVYLCVHNKKNISNVSAMSGGMKLRGGVVVWCMCVGECLCVLYTGIRCA